MNTSTIPNIPTLFEKLLNTHHSVNINANPHADAIEYLIQNPQSRHWIDILKNNANISGVLDMLFRVGFFDRETGAKLKTPQQFQSIYEADEDTWSETNWFNIWRFLFRNPSPDALRILRANETEIEYSLEKGGRFDRQSALIEMAKNTNPDTMAYLYGRIINNKNAATATAPWFYELENFWTEIFQNETPAAMQLFRENIIGFYNAFYDTTERHLTFEIHEPTYLSRAFFDFLDDVEFNRTEPLNPSGHLAHQEDFLLYFYESVCLADLGYNKNAAHFILQRQDPNAPNYVKIEYYAFSANSSSEAVQHLLTTPSNIVWDVFCESNTHNDAIKYMSDNRRGIDMKCIVKNGNPGAMQILAELIEERGGAPPTDAHFWTILAQNPAHEAIDIIEAHFATAEAAVSLPRLAQSLFYNTNPRVQCILEHYGEIHGGGGILTLWNICTDFDEENGEYFCNNPMIFEYGDNIGYLFK
jgi:hypothetical protein